MNGPQNWVQQLVFMNKVMNYRIWYKEALSDRLYYLVSGLGPSPGISNTT
jgi:hypothetical protein